MNPVSSPSRRRPPRRTPPAKPISIFIAYGDVPAARDAIDRVKKLLGASSGELAVQPMLWRFDQLGHAQWREMTLHDAARAHAIVLAMGRAPSLSGATDAWLTALTDRQGGTPITCLTLMGDEAWTISLQRSATAARTRAAAREREDFETHRRHSAVTARAA